MNGRGLLLGLVLASVSLVGAMAQTPPTYVSPSGTNLPAGAVSIMGLDSVTGLKCLTGATSTCQVPFAGSVSGGGFNLTQIGGVAVTAPTALSPDPVYFPTTPTVNLGGSAPASGEYLSTQPTLSSTNVSPLLFDTRGNLKVTVNTNNSSTAVSLATSTNQTTANTSLGNIDTSTAAINTKTPALGSAASAASSPVVIASDQTAVPVTFPTTMTLSCQYNVAPPTQTDGTSGVFQCDNRLHLGVTLFGNNGATAISASRNDQTTADSTANGKLVGLSEGYVHNGTTWYQAWAEAPGSGNMAAAIQKPYAPQASAWNFSGTIANSTTAQTLKAAPGSVLTACVTSLQVSADVLGGITPLAIRSGAGGTVVWKAQLQATTLNLTEVNLPIPVCALATNTLLEVVTTTAVTGNVVINAQGYSF